MLSKNGCAACCVTRYDEVVSADEIRVTGNRLSQSVGIIRLDRRVPLIAPGAHCATGRRHAAPSTSGSGT
jgi:hypothetical protein